MKFSVLMSVYKSDKCDHFEIALRSVTIQQILKPAQVVIVKDGPVDEKIDLIIEMVKNECQDICFDIISLQENKGLAKALNIGIEKCRFEYIARMDADDISRADRFLKQINYFKNNMDCTVVGGFISEFDCDPELIKSVRTVKKTHEEIVAMAKVRCPMNHMTVMYKKSDIEEVGKYAENFGKLEDYKLWIDLILNGKKLANIEDVLVDARVGNGFIERRSDKNEINDWDMLQDYLLNNKMINIIQAELNKIYIRLFINMPVVMKWMLYKFILRK